MPNRQWTVLNELPHPFNRNFFLLDQGCYIKYYLLKLCNLNSTDLWKLANVNWLLGCPISGQASSRPLPAVNINNYETCSQCDTHAGSFRVQPWPGQPWNLPPYSHLPWVPVVDIDSTNYHRMGKQHTFWHNFRDQEVRVSMAGMRQAPTLVSLLEQQPFLRGLHFHILIPIKGLIYQKKKKITLGV